jgi:lysophospholipase L1-like esterase
VKWQGKRWGTLGDSITAANGYQPLVGIALGFAEILNYGRSGCPMTAGGDTDEGSTVMTGRGIDPKLDCVTVFAGTNDYRLNKPLGRLHDKDRHTFIGAYTTLIESILAANPSGRLNLWTPLQRDKDGFDIDSANEQGHRLADYTEAVVILGRRYALPVLDLYAESGLNKLTLPVFTRDGLHPNETGHARIASLAIPFLERI